MKILMEIHRVIRITKMGWIKRQVTVSTIISTPMITVDTVASGHIKGVRDAEIIKKNPKKLF